MISWCDGRNGNTKDYSCTSGEHGNGCGGSTPDSPTCSRIGRWCQRLDDRSRMSREVHVRFWEGVGVQFSRATQLFCRFGRPRDFIVDSSPSCFAMTTTQSELPNGRPRCTLDQRSSNSVALSGALTNSIQFCGRSIGQSVRKSKPAVPFCLNWYRLEHRHTLPLG
jgi:hypothetical protein